MFKTVIAGSRCYTEADLPFFTQILDEVFAVLGEPQFIISGKARGADTLGELYAESRDIAVIEMPAEWDKYGKSAGHRRNKEMAVEGNSLVAFWDGESRGTQSMIKYAKEQNHDFVVVINTKLNEVEFHGRTDSSEVA